VVRLFSVKISTRRFLAEGAVILIAFLAIDQLFADQLKPEDMSMLALLPVMWLASRQPLPVALIGAAVIATAVNYLYFPPHHTFGFQSTSDVITCFIYIAVAGILGVWAARFRRQLDVTEGQLKIIEHTRQRELSAAAERDRLRSSLLSSVSHDLRTPITSILGSVEAILEEEAAASPEQLRALHLNIQESAEILARQVDNVLSMIRLDVGDVTPRRAWVDLSDVVGSALQRFSETDRQAIDVNIDDYLPPVWLDFAMAEAVAANLFDNALKFRETDTPVEVRGFRQNDAVIFDVRNAGPVVAEADRERVFERFGRADVGRMVPGTGLGLSICRGFAEAMGARIVAMPSVNPRGMTFRVTWPLGQTEAKTA
jgi:K+-sensing histidine kinase KdpD